METSPQFAISSAVTLPIRVKGSVLSLARIAGLFSESVGVLKEICGPLFNPEDLRANRESLAAAKQALWREVQPAWWRDRFGFAL